MAIERMDHIHFTVKDIQKAMRFFSGILGTRFVGPLDRSVDPAEPRQALYAFDTSGIELVSPKPGDPLYKLLETDGEGITHIGWKVRDIEKEVATIQAQGVKLWRKGIYHNIKYAVFEKQNSFGVRIELIEYDDVPAVAIYNADKMGKIPWFTERTETGVERIDHIHITVRDIEGAMRFFSKILGTKFVGPLDRSVDHAEPRQALYAFDTSGIELVSPKPGDPLYKLLETDGEGITHLGWKVKDIDKVTAAIQAKGVKLWRKGVYHNIKYSVFEKENAYGIRIELVEYEYVPTVAAMNANIIGKLPWFTG